MPRTGTNPRFDNTQLREAVLEYMKQHDLDWSELSIVLGYGRMRERHNRTPYIHPDTTRIKRALGLSPEPTKKGKKLRKRITLKTADYICNILGIELWEVGIDE
jgi:hypothetical protein